ncbi:MAG: AMP-binding protein [Acidimicrobiales bacterium]|nr:AMP-binding protein [Acidimicrobiales bacterium]
MADPTPDILTVHALARPDKPAVIDDRPGGAVTTWTFAELEERANRLGHVLVDLGAGPGTKVVWCGQNSPGVVAMVHAARKVGATAVPLNYRLSAEEAAYVVDNSDAALVYVDAEFAGLFDRIRADLDAVRAYLVFDGPAPDGMLDADALAAEAPATPPAPPAAGGAAATMIYTSGTTGKPKGAVRRGVGSPQQTAALLGVFGYTADDVYLTTGPLYHSGPGGWLGIAHALGMTAVTQRKFDPEDWLRLVDRHRVTTTFSAPTPIRLVCNLPREVMSRYDRSSMRVMVANAAPWSSTLKQAFVADFPADSLWEVYGSTELGVNTVLRPEDQLRKPGSCGQPAPLVEVALFDDDGVEVTEPGATGELFVRSASVFSEYYKAPDKTAADRRGEWTTVGDIAYRDAEGYLFICDRKKDMVISGGMNIYPAEIESALEHHPDVFDVAVFGIPSEEWGESVHAVVVPRPGSGLSEADVVAFAREHLAHYRVPRSVSFIDELPRTGSGKILKRELRAPFWVGHESRVL